MLISGDMKGSAQSGALNHLIAFGKFHCSSKKKKKKIVLVKD